MTPLAIGALSDLAGVKIPTRYYEGIGLLPATERTDTNRRTYDDATVRRLKFIRHERDLSFQEHRANPVRSHCRDCGSRTSEPMTGRGIFSSAPCGTADHQRDVAAERLTESGAHYRTPRDKIGEGFRIIALSKGDTGRPLSSVVHVEANPACERPESRHASMSGRRDRGPVIVATRTP